MILLVFPHQLFERHPGLERDPDRVVLIEDSLFFGDARYAARMHQQKLWLHRASMKRYEQTLIKNGHVVEYLEYEGPATSLREQLTQLPRGSQVCCIDPTDFLLHKRLTRVCVELELQLDWLPNPGFLNSAEENAQYRSGKKRWFMADFYKWQRQRMDILMEGSEPVGGKWSFDADNRKKIPKAVLPEIPQLDFPRHEAVEEAARDYVRNKFDHHPGSLDQLVYPTTPQAAKRWLQNFLSQRFEDFGVFEDAIEQGQPFLWHSVLTPMLNIGLLTPKEVVSAALKHAAKHGVPLNSLEGFLRQIIGWREFMRATYEDLGVQMRTTNHWQHHRQVPQSFYDGSTGILPIDDTIQRILHTGYCHHIERLMVLGGFMFLCEMDPDEIYTWFMEMFVDSYDWVMVPNVYAMSQNADGGLITTKPYFSGSSYIRKMSHYKQDEWCRVWDGLYWRWIHNHAEELGTNPRWAMMCSMVKKMEATKLDQHLHVAEQFLDSLDSALSR